MNDLDAFTKKFTAEKCKHIQLGKRYYFASEETTNIAKTIANPMSIGVLLGEADEKNDFRASIYLLEWLSSRTKNKLFVNEKAEWLFLCDRDVLPESITKDESTQDIFLVQNKLDENLGLGKKFRKGKTYFIKNIIDRGDFLRRERK
jgi:ribosome biogenesis protein Nip4